MGAIRVTFYFDPVSPYAWLASKALPRIEQIGGEIAFQPVLFAGLLNAHGQKGPAEIEAKRRYIFRDVMREATRAGLPFRGPPGHPFNPLQALRMSLALTEPGARRRFALALMDACWEQGDDVSDIAVLKRIAADCALDGDALEAQARQAGIKVQLASDTEQAIRDGVFGVPTFKVDGDLFWGADRVHSLLRYMQGARIDEAALAAILARPPLAER
ncbi:2-hydroxychromene-2-carboxylate isomerase [Massilia sp. PWRC2]|uniref:2-hydroxychromene-2-carboxylate isomerase n=1 Tax=Massilia sp. PWRC2 TaxID=2804626 RepID=UPI003CF22252